MAKRVAVIDIGSNSIRMVIYEKTSRFAFHLLHEEKSKVRLSEDIYKYDGNLQEIPMQRTFDALSNFLEITRSFKTTKLLCVATSALRDAPNKKLFLNRVKEKLKLNIKIISGEKEAYYGGIACSNLLPEQNNALSIDIGGGSTELAYIDKFNVSNTISLKLGTVRLKELYFDKDDLEGATQYIDKELEKLETKDVTTLVGIGGTFRAISNTIMIDSSYPLNKIHAYSYSTKTLLEYISKIQDANEDELKALHIKSNRFDVIKPGTLILQRVLKKINISNVITSGVGVREGVYLADLLRNSNHKFPHNFNTSVKHLIDLYVENSSYSNQLAQVSKKIFDLTKEHLKLDTKYRYELSLASKLYPTGSGVHLYSQNKHTYYILQNALEYGFSHESTTLISTIAKYSKNKLPSASHFEKYAALLPTKETTNALSFILSLSIALLSHRPRNIDFDLSFKDSTLFITSKNNLYIAKYASSKLECSDKGFHIEFNS